MKLIRNIINSPPLLGSVLTIGNFDGVHLGHRRVLSSVYRLASRLNLSSVAMIFEPQPLEYFNKSMAPARLTSFREKYDQIAKIGLDYLLCIPFNKRVLTLTAEQFIQKWLIKHLAVKYLIVGEDFTFGANKKGNVALLEVYAGKGAFTLKVVPSYRRQGHRISSTAIRQALSGEQFELARQLLGRRYSICGKVIHGNAFGRQLGFPTANIHLSRLKTPLNGVYLVDVYDKTVKKKYSGVANIGYRPTFNGRTLVLEVNIFDFDKTIYGHYLQITFLKRIREEKKFLGTDALKAQIKRDICIAKKIRAKWDDSPPCC